MKSPSSTRWYEPKLSPLSSPGAVFFLPRWRVWCSPCRSPQVNSSPESLNRVANITVSKAAVGQMYDGAGHSARRLRLTALLALAPFPNPSPFQALAHRLHFFELDLRDRLGLRALLSALAAAAREGGARGEVRCEGAGTRVRSEDAGSTATSDAAGKSADTGGVAVIHFAGLKAVGESTKLPLLYYDANVGSTTVRKARPGRRLWEQAKARATEASS